MRLKCQRRNEMKTKDGMEFMNVAPMGWEPTMELVWAYSASWDKVLLCQVWHDEMTGEDVLVMVPTVGVN